MLALSAAFSLGIALVDAPHASLSWMLEWTPVLLALGAAAMLAGLILVKKQRILLAGVLALTGFAVAGVVAAQLFEFRFPPNHVSHLVDRGINLREPVRLSGRIVTSPVGTAYGSQFDLEVAAIEKAGGTIPMSGKIRVWLNRGEGARSSAPANADELKYGDRIRAPVTLERPNVYRNPGVFDFRRWMASVHNIHWVGRIKSASLVERLPRSGPPTVGELLARTRRALLDGIDRLYPPWTLEGRYGSVLKAVLLGDRSSLDSATIEKFRVTGLYHLLVISGLHVGLLALLVVMLLRLTPLSQLWRSVIVLVFLLGYCSLVEQRAPTTRAAIMIAAYLLARFFYRQHAALNAVGLAALVLLVVRPPWLFEAGFELSFAAALLIVAVVAPILELTLEPYRRALKNVTDVSPDFSMPPRAAQFRLDVRRAAAWLQRRIPWLETHPSVSSVAVTWPVRAGLWIVGMIFFTAVLQIGLMLPLAATFHRVTFAGIGLNALAIPVMVVLLAVAVPTVVLGALWPALTVWPAKVLTLVMGSLFFLTDLPHLPPWLSYRVPTPPEWVAWAFAVSIVVAAVTLGRNRRVFWIAVSAVLVLAGLISTSPFPPQIHGGKLEVTAIDCGPGDSFFVVLPNRTTMLMDAGDIGRGWVEDPFESRRWDAGEDIVSPYLWSRQIKKIDIVVMSRGSPGELPGFAAVARNFQIGELWHAASGLGPRTLEFLDELARRGIPVRAVATGDRFDRGSTALRILWPPHEGNHDQINPATTQEIVLRISHGDSAVLFTSKLNRGMKKWLAGSGSPLHAGVIAVTHYSSATAANEDLLEDIAPRVVLLSGETRGRRGLSLFRSRHDFQLPGLRLYRTRLEGAIAVEMQRGKIAVRPYESVAGEGTSGLGSAVSLSSSSSVR